MAVITETSAVATAIRPFMVEFPAAEVADLRARSATARFREREPLEDLVAHPLGDHHAAALKALRTQIDTAGTAYDPALAPA